METSAIENLKKLEDEKYRIKDSETETLVEKTKKANWFMDSIIQTDNDLGNYLIHKVEQSLKRELTKEEVEIIKNIIISSNFDKTTSMQVVQEKFDIKFSLYYFEKI